MSKIFSIIIVIWLLILTIFTIYYVHYDREMQFLDMQQDQANINSHYSMIGVINDNTDRISDIEMHEVENEIRNSN